MILAVSGIVFLTSKPFHIYLYIIMSTLRLHCNAVVRVHGENALKRNALYTHDRCSIFLPSTSFTGFHVRKQMPHPPSFGMGHQLVYLVLWL